jgi:RNA polymerase sigma-70 factor (ECF subfamily)
MTTSRQADQQLIERVQRGDNRAFDLLVLKYESRILTLVSRFVRDYHEAQDVTQEAFIKAYKALKNFRGESAFYTWLYRIAVNTAKNHLVSKGRRPPGSDIELEDAEYFEGIAPLRDIENPENVLDGMELAKVVDSAMKNLPEDLRTAVTLREFDGLSYEDIAVVMNCPVGTVRSRIFRARETIAKQVEAFQAGNSSTDLSDEASA